MTLSERWLASEQRHAMSYERWLEYVATDAETQLETARKALDRIRLHNDSYVSHRIATEALDLIGAGQTDKCPRCGVVALNAESLAAGCLNCGYTAGQKGGK